MYVIIRPNNNDHIKINYLQYEGEFYYYSPIILNIINERLCSQHMDITNINPDNIDNDGADNYYYHPDDKDLMTINTITQGNYFIYKKSVWRLCLFPRRRSYIQDKII